MGGDFYKLRALRALRQSGCCLSVLEDVLMENDIVYDK